MIMRTNEKNLETASPIRLQNRKSYKSIFPIVLLFSLLIFGTLPASAHCDSYDGPTINDAVKALETNNVDLVLKWITPEQQKEIIPLFKKTYALKTGDKEIYAIVEKHFFETLVRLHRETEGAPYTGLKPAGTTKKIVQLSDQALENKNIEDFLVKLNAHMGNVIKEKYEKAVALGKVKNDSPEKGREYVEAYVDYTHTIEAIHDMAEQSDGHSAHKH